MNLNLYKPELLQRSTGAFGESRESEVSYLDSIFEKPVLAAFLADDDLQEITVTSTNLLFSLTVSKQHVGFSIPQGAKT